MKIYFKQSDKAEGFTPFSTLDLHDCYFKHLLIDSDASKVTRNPHHHNGFEIHIIKKGQQEYEVDGKRYNVHSGEFLFIPPFVKHQVISFSPGTEKYSVTFSSPGLAYLTKCVSCDAPTRLFENALFIINEHRNTSALSKQMIQNAVFECSVMLLRLCGFQETSISQKQVETGDLRLESVKAYIQDNIESWITVSDIATYCYVSTKQMTRIFLQNEGISPAQYISKQRAAHIQKLLDDKELSLKAISKKMNFQNEYYFNTFVKKHLGMPPSEYRKMTK